MTFAQPDNGIVSLPSSRSVDRTIEKIEELLQEKSVELFGLVDHSGEAERVGLAMRPTAPSVAIDLPLKLLVSEDENVKVWISYNSPAYLQARHRLPAELMPNVAVIEVLAKAAAE